MSEEEISQREALLIKYEENLTLATEFVSKMSDYANHNRDITPFIDAFKREHRTLQQTMFGMMLKLMEAIADDDYRTDLRNEDSQKIAQKLLAGFKEVKRQDYISDGCTPSRADQYVSGEFSKPSNYLRRI